MPVYFKAAYGEGRYELTSFDNALLRLGLANANLVRLSSVFPENATLIYDLPREIKIGEVIKAVYTYQTANHGSAVSGLALGIRKEGGGLFYEYSAKNKTEKEVKEILNEMIKEAFEMRNWELLRIEYAIAGAEAKKGKYITTLAIAAFID